MLTAAGHGSFFVTKHAGAPKHGVANRATICPLATAATVTATKPTVP